MGEIHLRTQKKVGEIYSRELFCGGPCGPIGADISATRDEGYGTVVCRAGNFSAVKKIPCLFFGKSKTLPPIVGALSMFLVNKSGLGL